VIQQDLGQCFKEALEAGDQDARLALSGILGKFDREHGLK